MHWIGYVLAVWAEEKAIARNFIVLRARLAIGDHKPL